MSECKRCSELTERVRQLEAERERYDPGMKAFWDDRAQLASDNARLTEELAAAMKWFYHEENKAIGFKKERDRLREALEDIKAHTIPPFTTEKWVNYIHEVATEALQSRQINSQDSAGVYPSQGPEGHGGRQSPEREMPTVIRGDSLSRPAEVTQQVINQTNEGKNHETKQDDLSDGGARRDPRPILAGEPNSGRGGPRSGLEKENLRLPTGGGNGRGNRSQDEGHPPAQVAAQSEHDTRSVVDWEKLASRFLAWPLPQSVCADPCATMRDYPHLRSGTNLLTADEAVRMLKYVLEWDALDPSNYSKPVQKAYAKFQAAMAERKQSEPATRVPDIVKAECKKCGHPMGRCSCEWRA